MASSKHPSAVAGKKQPWLTEKLDAIQYTPLLLKYSSSGEVEFGGASGLWVHVTSSLNTMVFSSVDVPSPSER